jgi:CSLREA domain-containing protein
MMAPLTLLLALLISLTFALGPARQVHAASTINVTTTADENGTGAGCSLREAFKSADDNANFGGCTGSGGGVPFTINVPAGTYTLTVDELKIGDATNTNTTIVGAGAASAIIQQTLTNKRVIDVNSLLAANVSVSISGVTLTGGRDPSDNFGGAGIIAGGPGNTLSLSNCIITGNTNNAGLTPKGGGVEFAGGGVLNINNCTISNNIAGTSAGNLGVGGGVDYQLLNLAGAAGQGGLSITNTTFSNNVAGAANSGAGGAVRVAATTTQAPSGLTISNNTFTGNQANAASNGLGGAIANASSNPVTIQFNRFFNNSATGGATGIYKVVGSGSSTNATKNWWGCNAGPGNAGCDSIGGETANITAAPRLVLSHTSAASALLPGEATILTASFLKDSAGGPVAASNLGALIGMPISFTNAQKGSLSSAQTTIQANGTATATFTANAPGAGQADAIVDNGTATANIMINRPPTTVTSINRNASSATNADSISWTIVFANPLSGLSASNLTLTNSGLGGAPAITGVTPVGGAPATTWIVTASTGSGDGTLGLNLANDTGLDYILSNLPFTGQAYTIDRTAPTVTINQAAGQADPTDSAPINFTVVFDEPVTGFTGADVALSGTAGATTAAVTGSGTTYNVAVSGITTTGTVIASIPANVANEAAGNGNVASTSSDNIVTVSTIPKRYVYIPLIEAP